jgi:hypothetical protein
MKPYLLIVWNDIEPELVGPFADDEARDNHAKGVRGTDPDKEHGLYQVWASGRIEISAFHGTDLDELLTEKEA